MLATDEIVPPIEENREGELAMLGEENKALVRLFNEEFWNKGNIAGGG